MVSSSSNNSDLTAAFQTKVEFMSKKWTPQSAPSNRDRLELYALHKQAVSGDAPSSFSTAASAAERSKYQSWRSKSGTTTDDAMRLYLQEADRQVRMYGSKTTNGAELLSSASTNGGMKPPPPQSSSTAAGSGASNGNGTSASNSSTNAANSNNNNSNTPRGLAAIPLLCAAAAESRPAYIRRLSQTQLETAWWQRQEPLAYPPGTFGGLPETTLLLVAKFIEYISLTSPTNVRNIVASFLWPVHNTLLSVWMLLILYLTTARCAWNTILILVWGSRRTGISLGREWDTILPLVSKSVSSMVEPHQAVTVRLTGLVALPFPTVFNFLNRRIPNMAVGSIMFDTFLALTWWYWIFVVPFLMICLLWTAAASGTCFAIIEFAGV
eukprot:CAMPEP_0113456556 /NCGR_PEP_ID=MMETSP0014_2-20120614/8949_1 /TAXON_ID=2857 /ORGANISM="Nitzschia sp." /LENGTH=381 /DNA_ID=CAMNT_0000348015 /DNA_START=122 /DNA_END=1267 /DNA_ORIENTATION=+ /assembly_acc=CAM_ASM_000159